jgi:hypothetical protein
MEARSEWCRFDNCRISNDCAGAAAIDIGPASLSSIYGAIRVSQAIATVHQSELLPSWTFGSEDRSLLVLLATVGESTNTPVGFHLKKVSNLQVTMRCSVGPARIGVCKCIQYHVPTWILDHHAV